MKRVTDTASIREVALPFSDGLLSARLWKAGERNVVGVPELGLHCYGVSESEAVFRLFTTLLKYYRQLKQHEDRLGERGLSHLAHLKNWVAGIEKRMTSSPIESRLVSLRSRLR
ncbi:hypothetical protein KF707_12865 [Candidatus Obscuribacterales bacterium]|nr:hypothetical protein [Candidatus Obscuribacterales bacterium]MBX3137127.1 hypothetical protein [Candidatus Obscuribacterales bacterium]MBX3149154.1 hypothetical protein [Candidatus Obscuribacterales bacterium]